jgi:itaconyl-CoA hydratase
MAEFAFASHVHVGENRYRERYGLDFEDFQVGQVFKHRPGQTVSQQDNVEESMDSLNQAMLHFDENYAAKTEWKKPLLVSTITLQRMVGLSSSGDPACGKLTVETKGFNQDGKMVCTMAYDMLIYKRGHAPFERANY